MVAKEGGEVDIDVDESMGGEEQRARLGITAIGQNVRIEHFIDEDHVCEKQCMPASRPPVRPDCTPRVRPDPTPTDIVLSCARYFYVTLYYPSAC